MMYCAEPELWKEHVAPVGALEAWLKSDKLVETGKWVTAEDKAMHDQIMQRNYNPGLNWYRASIHNLNLADESGDPRSPDGKLDPVLHMRSLLIIAERDPLTKGADKMMAPVAENLRIERFPAGHWVQLEMPEEVNRALEGFVRDVEAAGGK
jgi:soluble epoxide hydrolase/lipid-phosphate phosphatase